jgi:hypothetical protein
VQTVSCSTQAHTSQGFPLRSQPGGTRFVQTSVQAKSGWAEAEESREKFPVDEFGNVSGRVVSPGYEKKAKTKIKRSVKSVNLLGAEKLGIFSPLEGDKKYRITTQNMLQFAYA